MRTYVEQNDDNNSEQYYDSESESGRQGKRTMHSRDSNDNKLDCDLSLIGCSPNNTKNIEAVDDNVRAYKKDHKFQVEEYTEYDYNDDYDDDPKKSHDRHVDKHDEERTHPAEISYMTEDDGSLAARNSLGLQNHGNDEEEDPIILEHALPDNAGKARRRRRGLFCLAVLALIGIIVLTSILTSSSTRNNEKDINVNDGSNVGSIASENNNNNNNNNNNDNVFDLDNLPDSYYVLEPQVWNASALLDYNTPEGKAFQVIAKQQEGIFFQYDDSTAGSARKLKLLQRYALMTLYFGTEGGSWTNTQGWLTTNDVCDGPWHGIICQNAVVTGIDLDRNNLQGSISEDLCLLTFLKTVVLSGNSEAELPSCISKHRFLEVVRLQGNALSGKLPKLFHSMPSLTSLDLSDNNYTGSIDSMFPKTNNGQMVAFPTLSALDLSNNDLSGEVPESQIRSIRNLQTLTLNGNPKLTGSLNEICKGSLRFAAADCISVTCRCCQSGEGCPSF